MAQERRYFLDWLRALAIVGILVPGHSAFCFYNHFWFHIQNAERSKILSLYVHAMLVFYLPLFFILAGASSSFALQKVENWWAYIQERFLRLLIPLALGILPFVMPQVYLERLFRGQFQGSIIEFFPKFFHGVYPKGNFSWHHLWFLAYLFVVSVVTIPLWKYFRSHHGQQLLPRLAAWGSQGRHIFLLAIPLVTYDVTLLVKFPKTLAFVNDWTTLLSLTTVYIYGYILFSHADWMAAVVRNKKLALILTLSGYVILLGIEAAWGRPAWKYSVQHLLYIAVETFTTWNIILALFGYGQHYLNFSNRLLRYLNEASLPFYIIHQLFVITAGYFILRQPWGIAPKYISMVILAYIATFFTYDILIRRIPLLRFCLGMRPRQNPTR
jgi:peptidoglycan/LPS O-acetylase OafA/YrhL